MPIYEYKCKKCDNKFEQILSASEAKKVIECDKCKSTNVEKVISAPAGLSMAGGSSESSCPPNSMFS